MYTGGSLPNSRVRTGRLCLVACRLLERDPIVMRAPEEWEGEFLEFQQMVDDKYAKEYPPEFLERQEAFAAKLEAEQGGGADMDQTRLQARAEGTGTSSFSQFYAGDDALDEDSDVRCERGHAHACGRVLVTADTRGWVCCTPVLTHAPG